MFFVHARLVSTTIQRLCKPDVHPPILSQPNCRQAFPKFWLHLPLALLTLSKGVNILLSLRYNARCS
jgi:hypothetical protein